MNKKIALYSTISFLVLASMLLSACGAPATTAAPVATQPPATTAPVATQAPATAVPTEVPPTATVSAEVQACGTAPVVMNAYFETGFDIPFKLVEEFTKQFPNVTFDTKQDQFANLITSTPLLLSSDNPPDLLRLPTMVSFAKDGLLLNLDKYATMYRLGSVASAAAQPEPCRGGRHARLRVAVCHGPQLQPDRHLLQ